jgi:hypothetical protein
VARIVAHVACWLPFIIGPVRLAQHGWQPIGDEAAIALRSWNALTNHGPLVGQATRLAHGVFDPGPLEYWLLSIPVHLNPVYGVLWGGAFWCIVACSLAIEAAWVVRGEIAGLAASGLILVLLLWMPAVALPASWNPWFGMMFFLAALAAAWAVIAGHRRWWPVLVITASVAAQAHLMFTLGSAALVLLALIVGIADAIRARAGYWWVLIGLLAGAGCWSAPAFQQLTMPDGNIAALINSTGSSDNGARTGASFGLKALTSAIQPIPLWWKSAQQPLVIFDQISARSSGYAVAVLILLAVVGIAAIWPLRCRWLAALAAVTLLLSLAALATYSSVPVHYTSLHTLNYLIIMVFPVGALSWLVIGSGVALTILLAAGRALAGAPAHSAGSAERAATANGKVPAGTAVSVATAMTADTAAAADPAATADTAAAAGPAGAGATALAAAGPDAAAGPADTATALAAPPAGAPGPQAPAGPDLLAGPARPGRATTPWDLAPPSAGASWDVAPQPGGAPPAAASAPGGAAEAGNANAPAGAAAPAGTTPPAGHPSPAEPAAPTSAGLAGPVTGWPGRGLDWMVGGIRDWTANGLRAGVAAAVAVWVVLLTVLATSGQMPTVRLLTADPVMRIAPAVARQIERALPPQQMAMTMRDYHNPAALGRLTLGVTWALTPPGYHPEIIQTRLGRELGDRFVFRGGQMTLVTVIVRQHSTRVVVTPWTVPNPQGLGVTGYHARAKRDLIRGKRNRHSHHRRQSIAP